MLDKFAGYKTQIRVLEKKLKEMDHSKLSPAKVKEVTEAINNLKALVKEKEDKREERKRKKEEAAASQPAEAPKAEAAVQPTEVVKESLTTPIEVTKESETTHFAIDARVEPVRGTPGSWGTVIRAAGTNGDPLVYVKWAEGTLRDRDEYGAYYESDLRMKVEKEADYEQKREEVYNLEADLRSNYERSIKDLEEEHKTALEKGEASWAYRIEEKINALRKTYEEKYGQEKQAQFSELSDWDKANPQEAYDKYFKTYNEVRHEGLERQYLVDKLNKLKELLKTEKTADTGPGGTEKLKVVDFTPAHDKDPQEKEIGYGGDRAYGWQTAPKSDRSSLPLESSQKEAAYSDKCWYADCKEKATHMFQGGKDDPRSGQWCDEHFKKLEKKHKKAAVEPVKLNVGSSFYNVTPLPKPSPEEFSYDIADSLGTNLFKITAKEELNQEHLAKIIETELGNKKESSSKCAFCGQDFPNYAEYAEHKAKGHKSDQKAPPTKEEIVERFEKKTPAIIGKLTANLAFLKKGAIVSVLAEDKVKGQVKFASLDNSLRGWAPSKKFAVYNVPEANLVPHENHQDEVLSQSGNELLVSCPANSTNVIWRAVEAPPATPESLNPDVTASEMKLCPRCGQKSTFLDKTKEGANRYQCDVCHRTFTGNKLTDKEAHCGMSHKADEELPENEQSEEDIYIHDDHGQTIASSPAHGIIAKQQGDDWEMLYADIDAWMEQHNFYPSVWWVSDHGNVHNAESFYEWQANKVKTASLNINAHIRHEDGKWVIYSHDYKKKLGTYDSKEEAKKRLGQIEYFKHQGSLKPLSKKEALGKLNVGDKVRVSDVSGIDSGVTGTIVSMWEFNANVGTDGRGVPNIPGHYKPVDWTREVPIKTDDGSYMTMFKNRVIPIAVKEANVMETKCEECGKELGPEVFLSKYPVCGKCTKKRHEKAVGKKADQNLSLEQQVQSFKDRMQAVNERLANPPTKTAAEETPEDTSKVSTEDLTSGILHMIDMLETKVNEESPEAHALLEELENKVWEVELKLGIRPDLPEHEKTEPEHKEIVDEVEKESEVKVEADSVNTPPTQLPPAGFKYAWDPKNYQWILVQIEGATPGGY